LSIIAALQFIGRIGPQLTVLDSAQFVNDTIAKRKLQPKERSDLEAEMIASPRVFPEPERKKPP
jgi:hypothetical protein